MSKKIICCVHDKKSDVYEGFMVFNNTNEAIRSFEITCQQNETFKKWPEDFQFIHVGAIFYTPGEIDEQGNIVQKSEIKNIDKAILVLAEAKDFVKSPVNQQTTNEKTTK